MYENDHIYDEELYRINLHDILNSLDNKDDLVRCHKSYIVNPQYIDMIIGDEIILRDVREHIPLGQIYLDNFIHRGDG